MKRTKHGQPVTPPVDSHRLHSINETAEVLRLSRWTLLAWIRAGRLHAVRLGRQLFVSQAEIDRQVQSGSTTGAAIR